MDHDTVLRCFLAAINHFVVLARGLYHIAFVIEFVYFYGSETCSNIGSDFVNTVSVNCSGNELAVFPTGSFVVTPLGCVSYEKRYRYRSTPFDLRCRLLHFTEHVADKKKHVLTGGESFFDCDHHTTVFFGSEKGSLGIICDIDAARADSDSEFYLIHRCFLIVRDMCNMVERVQDDGAELLEV